MSPVTLKDQDLEFEAQNFLPDLYLTVSPATESVEGQYCDTEAGEMLLPAILQDHLTNSEICSPGILLGAETLAGSELAEIRVVNGQKLIAELHKFADIFGESDRAVADALPAILAMSHQLKQLYRAGHRLVREQGGHFESAAPAPAPAESNR